MDILRVVKYQNVFCEHALELKNNNNLMLMSRTTLEHLESLLSKHSIYFILNRTHYSKNINDSCWVYLALWCWKPFDGSARHVKCVNHHQLILFINQTGKYSVRISPNKSENFLESAQKLLTYILQLWRRI